ncbi:hypothetical protein Tco_0535964 [Tanacetum coccineum]
MDFSEFYKELEAEFWGASAKLMELQLIQLELRLEKIILGVSGPSSQLKFYASFGLQVHLGFHLLMMVLGASGSPPCGCVFNP